MDPTSEKSPNGPETSEDTLLSPPFSESAPTQDPPAIQPAAPSSPKRSHKKKATAKKKGSKAPKFKQPSAAQDSLNGSSENPEPSEPKIGHSSKESTSEKPFFDKPVYTAEQKREMVKRAAPYVQIGSAIIAQRIVRDPIELEHGLFIMTEKESQKIAKPVVSILARHQVGAEALGDTDSSDVISLVLALGAYVSDNLKDRKILRAQYGNTLASMEETSPIQEVRTSPSAAAPEEAFEDPADDVGPGHDAAEITPESQMHYLRGFVRPVLQ